MRHNEAVLLSLNARYWETKPGKYSYAGDPDNEYKVSYNPLAFGYSALWDSEVLFNGRITTEVKVGLVRHIANIFHGLLQWQAGQRGRKVGIEADLTKGGIVYNQDSRFKMSISYHKRYDLTGGRLESFLISYNGPTLVDNNGRDNMPYEHMVIVDSSGKMSLGYCVSSVSSPVCRNMSDIFQSVYR